MAQNREIKEETTELKSHETQLSASRCTPPQQTIPSLTPRATASSDPNDKPDGACPPRSGEEAQPADLPATQRPLKRPRVENPSRCSGSGCRRRVGLMGFRCRCGDVFCSEHRYSDRHECSFDYKAAGREAIRRENPVVRAAKLVKV